MDPAKTVIVTETRIDMLSHCQCEKRTYKKVNEEYLGRGYCYKKTTAYQLTGTSL